MTSERESEPATTRYRRDPSTGPSLSESAQSRRIDRIPRAHPSHPSHPIRRFGASLGTFQPHTTREAPRLVEKRRQCNAMAPYKCGHATYHDMTWIICIFHSSRTRLLNGKGGAMHKSPRPTSPPLAASMPSLYLSTYNAATPPRPLANAAAASSHSSTPPAASMSRVTSVSSPTPTHSMSHRITPRRSPPPHYSRRSPRTSAGY